MDSLCFSKWCSLLAVSVLRTRSKFSVFLSATMHLQRSSQVSSSPAFPLPLPFPGIFARMPPGLSAAKRKRIHFRRALHVVVMALNFWWSGSCFIPLEHLERAPSKGQQLLLRRLSSLMLADGPLENFEVLQSGRRFHQLIARLSEISDAVTKLGVGSGPYEAVYPGHDVPLDNSTFPELEPYKSLDASRLRVVGEGVFDASPFLSPELCMAYRYPDVLLFDKTPEIYEYPQRMDSAAEIAALAKLWDAKGLLHIHDTDIQAARKYELVRVFNCLKNSSVDRQIGDRRGRNSVEMRIAGPSSSLPTGPDLLDLSIDASVSTFSIICTDRRDFYHQFQTSLNRTFSNTVGPRIPMELLKDTRAFEAFATASRLKPRSRLDMGDRLGFSQRQAFPKCPPGTCMVAFKSIFQGDHAGVEIATSAHEGLLKSGGLLEDDTRVCSDQPFKGDTLCQGLVIDDFFAIASVPRSLLVDSPAERCFKTAKHLYAQYDILGSDDKDVVGARKAKIIGACVNASDQCQNRGHVLVSAPAEKRYALSWVSLQICQLSHTTDSLHLCVLGGWTSVLMYRRPFMSILQKAFHLVDMSKFDASLPKMIGLSRQVATEFTLLSVLVPLCISDVAVDFCDRLFATDASLNKGAIVSARIDPKVMQVLWKSCRSKGGYSKLLSPEQSVLARCIDFEEEPVIVEEPVRRPLAFRFDFVEVFAGASTVTEKVAARGFSVCCPIDITISSELNMACVHVVEWLIHLVQNHFVKAVMIEPPCTTFSIMRRPALRSKQQPFGFDLQDRQTTVGTKLAHRALQLLGVCSRYGISGILENPWSSKMKYLPAWRLLESDPHCTLVRCDSCAYGSIHLKAFAFLCVWTCTESIAHRCNGLHQHVPVEGSYTKNSATYVPRLAEALAEAMIIGIRRIEAFQDGLALGKVEGLENQLINELSLALPWTLDSVWTYRVSAHINVLELAAVVRLVSRLVTKGICLRVVILVDSNVVRCAASKGRSSSKALTKALVRLAALSVVGGIYVVFGFVPTRYNPSDDPTRDVQLRGPIPGLDLATWDRRDLFSLASLLRLKRWASNWVRLVLSILGSSSLRFSDRSLFRSPAFPFGLSVSSSTARSPSFPLDFDSTLGFPGEGPWQFTGCLVSFRGFGLCFLASLSQSHGVIFPRNSGDIGRQLQRSARPPLQEGRPVTGVTSQHRASYLGLFEEWIRSLGLF